MASPAIVSTARFVIAAALVVTTVGVAIAQDMRVVSPSEGETVVAERPYPVVWESDDRDARFEIDLHYCGSYSFCFMDEECGFFLTHLCLEGEDGCTRGNAGYDVTMPEPLGDVSGSGYRVRISEVGGDPESVVCSDDFYLMSSVEAQFVAGLGDPKIKVVSPNAESVAFAGREYTVEFDYENCFGDHYERFKIDLYTAEGGGDCGGWITSICDKPDIGCKDSMGDYDVVIPSSTDAGMYKIRVGTFLDDAVFGCSEAFQVLPRDRDADHEDLWV